MSDKYSFHPISQTKFLVYVYQNKKTTFNRKFISDVKVGNADLPSSGKVLLTVVSWLISSLHTLPVSTPSGTLSEFGSIHHGCSPEKFRLILTLECLLSSFFSEFVKLKLFDKLLDKAIVPFCSDFFASVLSSLESSQPPDLPDSLESWCLFLKRFVTGARALIRNDLASSVFPERSLFDLGLDGGLGGLSIVKDISSVDDAKTLVLDDPALIFPFFSQKGDFDVLLLRRLDPGLVCLLSSSSSLLDEFEEFDSLTPLELELPSCLLLFPEGDFELLLEFSGLNELVDSLFLPMLFDDVPDDGILSLDLFDFTELELDSEGTAGRWIFGSEFGSDCESWELTDMLRWFFFFLLYFDCDGSPFSMFNVDFRKSLFTYLTGTMLLDADADVASLFGTGGLPRASGDPPCLRFTEETVDAEDFPGHGGGVAFIFAPWLVTELADVDFDLPIGTFTADPSDESVRVIWRERFFVEPLRDCGVVDRLWDELLFNRKNKKKRFRKWK